MFVVVVLVGGGGGVTSLSLAGNSGHLTWVRYSGHKSSATHSCQCVQYFRVSKQWYGCQCLGFLTRAQMFLHAIAHRGCRDTVRESALTADSGRKIPCCTGDSNRHQDCAWHFSRMLYQLSYPSPNYYALLHWWGGRGLGEGKHAKSTKGNSENQTQSNKCTSQLHNNVPKHIKGSKEHYLFGTFYAFGSCFKTPAQY